MSSADSLHRTFGALSLPLAESTESDLAHLDPARDILLDLFAAALNSELEPVWNRHVVAAAQLHGKNWEAPVPVRQKLATFPTPDALAELKTGWPLLCVCPSLTPATTADFTMDQRSLTQRWDIDYILCPLTVGNLLRVQDVLRAAGKILIETVAMRGHKAYRTYTTQGATYASDVLGTGENCCNFFSCRVADMAAGPAEFSKGGPKYYACGLTLETVELSDFPGDGTDDGEAVPLIGTTARFGLDESGDRAITVRD